MFARLFDSRMYTGMFRRIEPLSRSRADWIQVDVGHRSENRTLVAKHLALVAPLPESSRASILAIGPPSDRFSQAAHEPGQIAETGPNHLDTPRICCKLLTLQFDCSGVAPSWRINPHPARRNLLVAPRGNDIGDDLKDDVQVIAHHCIRMDRNGETVAEHAKTILDPGFPVLE